MTREYSCRKCRNETPSLLNSMFLSVESIAELRTISLCDSDLFINANHRKLSASSQSQANSYYSGTESQQSISARSIYDNVECELRDIVKPTKFLMPPIRRGPLRNTAVNRSKSFQEPGQCRKHLSPHIHLRRNLHETNSEDRIVATSNRSSPIGSALSEAVIGGNEIADLNSNCDKKAPSGPFYVKIFRRMQKLSLQWRKCKKVSRGRSLDKLLFY